jgi:Tol biopolymer transport system component
VTSFIQKPLSEHFDGFARIVTDGVRVYLLERAGDHDNLVQTSTAGGQAHPVDAPFRSTRIFDVSPDRTEFLIGSFVARNLGLPLWIWPVQGGSPIRIGDILVDDASWAPDGQHVFYVRDHDIRTVQRDGTGDRVLIHTQGYPRWIRFSPNGRAFVFTVASPQSDSGTLWEASADGSNPHIRFPGWSDPPSECCAEWTPDGKYLVFTSSHSGSSNLWAVREKRFLLHWKAPRPVQLTPTARALAGSVLARNGTRAFVTSWNEASEFVRYDPGSRRFVPLPSARDALAISLSRDGAWAVVQNSDWILWRTRPDGSARLQLTTSPLRAAHPQWSPDGTNIAFEAHVFGQPVRAYVVSAEGGPLQEISSQKGEQSVPAWSPDGSAVAIALNVDPPPDSAALRGIYVVDWGTKRAAKIPGSEGLTSPMWSPDGKYFTAKTADQREVLLFDHQSQKWNTIATGTSLSGVTWSPDSKYLFEQNILDPGQPVYRLHAGDFKPERVVSFESFVQNGVETCVFETVAADGSLIVRLKRSGGNVYALDLDLP